MYLSLLDMALSNAIHSFINPCRYLLDSNKRETNEIVNSDVYLVTNRTRQKKPYVGTLFKWKRKKRHEKIPAKQVCFSAHCMFVFVRHLADSFTIFLLIDRMGFFILITKPLGIGQKCSKHLRPLMQ